MAYWREACRKGWEGIIAKELAIGVEPILALLAPPAIAPSNGKGKVERHGKELARRR